MKHLLILLLLISDTTQKYFRFRSAYSYPHYQKNVVEISNKSDSLEFSGTKICIKGYEYELYQISDSMVVGIDSLRKVYFLK